MTKFRDIFKQLQDENGRHIGVDPYHHLTIAGVAFERIPQFPATKAIVCRCSETVFFYVL